MKKILFASIVFCGLLAFGVQTHALSITPDDAFQSGPQTSQAQIDAAIAGFIGSSVELYKSDFDDGIETGPLAGSYNTVYDAVKDPTGATITYTGGLFVGPTAYLLVKDGNANPAWYLFDLTNDLGWDGIEVLELSGFWEGVQGSISHVTLYGDTNPVPEPGTLLLLGSGLAGLAAYKRRKKA